MRRRMTWAAAGVLAVLAAAPAVPAQDSMHTQGSMRDSTAMRDGRAGPAAMTSADPRQVALSTMHAVNQFEMKLGEAAHEKAAGTKVRRYGERLLRDHRFADQKVTALAAAEGIELLRPDRLPAAPRLQAAMQKGRQLMEKSGNGFDAMYVAMMVQGHEMATGMLGEAKGKLPEGEARTLVSRLLPILEQHLSVARHIRGDTDAPEASMSMSEGGTR